MGMPGDQLPSGQPTASPATPNAAGGGVPTGTPAASTPDVTPQQVEKMVPQKDLDRLRSTYDQKIAQSQQATQALQQQLAQLQQQQRSAELANLPEDERLAREIEQHEADIEAERQALMQQRQDLAMQTYIFQLRNYYASFGVPPSILATDDPQEMQDNMIKWALANSKAAAPTASTPTAPTPPPVTTVKPAAVGKISWSSLKVGSPEETEAFRKLMNRELKETDFIP